jgi:beta-galactosidase
MDCNSIRENYILNTGWKFKLGEEPKAWYKGFDDSSWRDVNIPHDWAVEHPFDINCSSGTGYLPGGKGYYRKAFFLPKKLKGKQVFITFDGVYKNSMVWCNSYYLGKRPNGYTQFCYDITDFVCFGDDPNVIVVKVQHEDIADSRWYTGSGIYRKVTVTVKDKIAIENNSVFIYTAKAEKEQAEILVQMSVSNAQEADAEISARHILYDRNRPVASSQNHHCVGAGGRVNDYQV